MRTRPHSFFCLDKFCALPRARPRQRAINPLHTLTVGSLTSAGGINFNGPDLDTPPGFGPFDGGQLTINVATLTFGPAVNDNIQGAVTFNGGASTSSAAAGSGGTFTVNTTGALAVNSDILATSGLQPSDNPPRGNGGTVNLNSSSGTVAIASRVQVSSADTPAGGAPRRRSAAGGNINLKSGASGTLAAPAVAINIANTGQLLSLLDAVAPGPGGKITILATGADSDINVNGDAGVPIDNISADRGTAEIRHTGDGGRINLNGANIRADVVKVGALGNNGVLTIGGGTITADTILRLYANGSNGQINFIANVTLDGSSVKTISANTVTVFQNVVVTIGGGNPADIYTNTANYSAVNGGNGSTNGIFVLPGGGSGATTHLGGTPPDFDGP